MITVEWDNEQKKTIRWYLRTGWTWEEFGEAQLKTHELINSVTWIVDSILFSESPRYIPANALTNMRVVSQNRHPQHGHSYVVGMQAFISVMMNTLGRITPNGNFIYFAKDEAAARAMIAETQKKRADSEKPVA